MAEQAPHSTDVDEREDPTRATATRSSESLLERAERHHVTRLGKYALAILVALTSPAVAVFLTVPTAQDQLAVSRQALAVGQRSLEVSAAGQALAACRAHQPPASECKTVEPSAWRVLEGAIPRGR